MDWSRNKLLSGVKMVKSGVKISTRKSYNTLNSLGQESGCGSLDLSKCVKVKTRFDNGDDSPQYKITLRFKSKESITSDMTQLSITTSQSTMQRPHCDDPNLVTPVTSYNSMPCRRPIVPSASSKRPGVYDKQFYTPMDGGKLPRCLTCGMIGCFRYHDTAFSNNQNVVPVRLTQGPAWPTNQSPRTVKPYSDYSLLTGGIEGLSRTASTADQDVRLEHRSMMMNSSNVSTMSGYTVASYGCGTPEMVSDTIPQLVKSRQECSDLQTKSIVSRSVFRSMKEEIEERAAKMKAKHRSILPLPKYKRSSKLARVIQKEHVRESPVSASLKVKEVRPKQPMNVILNQFGVDPQLLQQLKKTDEGDISSDSSDTISDNSQRCATPRPLATPTQMATESSIKKVSVLNSPAVKEEPLLVPSVARHSFKLPAVYGNVESKATTSQRQPAVNRESYKTTRECYLTPVDYRVIKAVEKYKVKQLSKVEKSLAEGAKQTNGMTSF